MFGNLFKSDRDKRVALMNKDFDAYFNKYRDSLKKEEVLNELTIRLITGYSRNYSSPNGFTFSSSDNGLMIYCEDNNHVCNVFYLAIKSKDGWYDNYKMISFSDGPSMLCEKITRYYDPVIGEKPVWQDRKILRVVIQRNLPMNQMVG